jgi:hypothetical protein
MAESRFNAFSSMDCYTISGTFINKALFFIPSRSSKGKGILKCPEMGYL